jgi:putative membrane protein
MKHITAITLAASLFASGAAFAQANTGATTTASPLSNSPSPAAISSSANPRSTAAPVSGANSFTEGQARSRIEAKGFGNVSGLQKDNKGIWRATAMKDGKSQTVSLDFQGNVVSN